VARSSNRKYVFKSQPLRFNVILERGVYAYCNIRVNRRANNIRAAFAACGGRGFAWGDSKLREKTRSITNVVLSQTLVTYRTDELFKMEKRAFRSPTNITRYGLDFNAEMVRRPHIQYLYVFQRDKVVYVCNVCFRLRSPDRPRQLFLVSLSHPSSDRQNTKIADHVCPPQLIVATNTFLNIFSFGSIVINRSVDVRAKFTHRDITEF